ncbi:BAHD acyltransferase [Senna tora]|uniref:BAHD acyltransferase n=1 Tax=Senna tora TaxID=362788 RepID=A0A834W9J7_9FABA|nr:BAHD acyltransferase [Senna tora]
MSTSTAPSPSVVPSPSPSTSALCFSLLGLSRYKEALQNGASCLSLVGSALCGHDVLLAVIRPSMASQTVNIRKRVVPPLPETTVGNFSSYFKGEALDEEEMELQGLVGKLRKGSRRVLEGEGADGSGGTNHELLERTRRLGLGPG